MLFLLVSQGQNCPPQMVPGGGIQDISVGFPRFNKGLLQEGLRQMLHPESQKPRPREQHETPGQVLPINRRKPFFGILPYARAQIIAAIQILNIIE